eukprot:365104-Chlamydomonas_euryale.AAC.5
MPGGAWILISGLTFASWVHRVPAERYGCRYRWQPVNQPVNQQKLSRPCPRSTSIANCRVWMTSTPPAPLCCNPTYKHFLRPLVRCSQGVQRAIGPLQDGLLPYVGKRYQGRAVVSPKFSRTLLLMTTTLTTANIFMLCTMLQSITPSTATQQFILSN